MQILNGKRVMRLIKCLAEDDTYELLNIESHLTIAEAMDSVSLKKLAGAIETKNVIKSISFLVMRLSEQFNMKGKFTPNQAGIMAMDLFEMFGYETLEDVVLIFKYARQGRIGDGKDFKLDSQTVFHKWVPEYLELKSIEREDTHSRGKDLLNTMASFQWEQDDIAKLTKSDGTVILPTGEKNTIGKRARKAFKTDHLEQPVITNRSEQFESDMQRHFEAQDIHKLLDYLESHKQSGSDNSKLLRMLESEIEKRKSA